MLTPDDAHRSLRRWLGLVLPAPWDVQPERREGLGRPSAIIIPAAPPTNIGSAYVREMGLDFDIFAYPEGVEGDPGASRAEAMTYAQLLDQAMTNGLALPDGTDYSFTMRVPVFDYTGIAGDESQAEGAQPYDFLPVSNWSVSTQVDPDDDTLYTVVAGLRVRWHRLGDTRRFRGAPLADVLHTPTVQ